MAISPFPDWYHLDTGDSSFQMSGWDAFETVDVLLVAAAIAAVVTVGRGSRWRSGMAGMILLVVGAAMVGIILIQLIDKPPLLSFGELAIQIGAWMALAGALLVFFAGALSPGITRRQQP